MALDSASAAGVGSAERLVAGRMSAPQRSYRCVISSGGAGSGKSTLSDFTVTKRINPLSADLFRSAALGSHFPEVIVSVPIGGPMSPFAIEYELRQVFVKSLSQSGSGDQTNEAVTLSYGALQQTIGTSSRFGWANVD